MARLPAIAALTDEILSARVGSHRVRMSSNYLMAHRSDFQLFESVEHLAISTDDDIAPPGTTDEQIKTARALCHHLLTVRSAVARELWARQVFIGADVIDELLFWVLRETTDEPVRGVLTWIRDSRSTRPGLLVFPVHSFGVLGAGLIPPGRRSLAFVNSRAGYAITPQTNSLDRTLDFMTQTGPLLGVKKDIPVDLISHWRRSRPTQWLERNPLLLIRVSHLPGSYYSNEALLLTRVRATTSLISMLSALQPTRDQDGALQLFSSRAMNNWQTLDIHHYLTLSDGPSQRQELDGDCVPIHAGRVAVSELTELAVDINPSYWKRRSTDGERIERAVERLYSAYLRCRFNNTKPNARTKAICRLFDSMAFFSRCHHQSSAWAGVVSLSTAFEMLLTDHYAPGVRATLTRRCKLLLRGVPGTRRLTAAVDSVYAFRSGLVHAGAEEMGAPMAEARKAYVLCLVGIVDQIDRLRETADRPIAELLGDG